MKCKIFGKLTPETTSSTSMKVPSRRKNGFLVKFNMSKFQTFSTQTCAMRVIRSSRLCNTGWQSFYIFFRQST